MNCLSTARTVTHGLAALLIFTAAMSDIASAKPLRLKSNCVSPGESGVLIASKLGDEDEDLAVLLGGESVRFRVKGKNRITFDVPASQPLGIYPVSLQLREGAGRVTYPHRGRRHRDRPTIHQRPRRPRRQAVALRIAEASDCQCLDGALVEVLVRLEDATTSAGPGIELRVQRAVVATTDVVGSANVALPAGEVSLTAVRPFRGAATAELALECGEVRTVELALESELLVENTAMESPQLSDGVLGAMESPEFRFVDGLGRSVPLEELFLVYFSPADGTRGVDLTDLFTVRPDGTVAASDTSSVLEALSGLEEGQFRVDASVPGGTTVSGEIVASVSF